MLDDQLRQLAIKEAASAGEEGTVKELVARVKDFLASGDENEIPLGITQTALSTVLGQLLIRCSPLTTSRRFGCVEVECLTP